MRAVEGNPKKCKPINRKLGNVEVDSILRRVKL